MPKNNHFMEILVSIIGDQFLLLTTLTLVTVAMFSKFFENLNASDELGTFLIYIFFVVIGVPKIYTNHYQNSTIIIYFRCRYFDFQFIYNTVLRKIVQIQYRGNVTS